MTQEPRLLPAPTLSGPKTITVEGASFGVPQDAQVVTTRGGALAYVLTAGRLHAFVKAGEVEIANDDLRQAVCRKFFSGRWARPS